MLPTNGEPPKLMMPPPPGATAMPVVPAPAPPVPAPGASSTVGLSAANLASIESIQPTMDFATALVVSAGCDLPTLRECVAHVKAGDFDHVAHKVVWSALAHHFEQKPELPSIMALAVSIEEITKALGAPLDPHQLQTLTNIMTSIADPNVRGDKDLVMNGLKDYLGPRRMKLASSKHGQDSLLEGEYDAFMEKMNAEYAQVMAIQEKRKFVSATNSGGVIRTAEEMVPMLQTGHRSLDFLLGGGMLIGDIGLVTAAPGVGKTNALVHFACAATAPDTRSLVMSLELKDRLLRARYTSMTASIPGAVLKTPYDTWDQIHQLKYAVTQEDSFPGRDSVYFSDMSDRQYSYVEIENEIEQWKEHLIATEGCLPDKLLVCVDWVDMMAPKDTKAPEWMQVATLLYELKYIAKRQDVALWTATQANKEGAKAGVALDMTNVSGGYHKNDALDISLLISKAAEDAMDIDELAEKQGDGSVELLLSLAKNRHGETGLRKAYRAPTLRMFDTEDDYRRLDGFMDKLANGQLPKRYAGKVVSSNGQAYHLDKLTDKVKE